MKIYIYLVSDIICSDRHMPRKRVFRSTTIPRYYYKITRQFAVAGFKPSDVAAVAMAVTAEWNKNFSIYNYYYNEMLKKFGSRIPVGQRGLYRAGLFKMIKAARVGDDVEAIIESYARKTGVDAGLLREIAAYFGLIESSKERSAAAPPSRHV